MIEARTDSMHNNRPPQRTTRDLVFTGLLILTLLLGGYFRFTGQNWDDFVRFHPDERYLTTFVAPNIGGELVVTGNRSSEVQAMCEARYPDNRGRGGYFDTDCSPYNPENIHAGQYMYGTLPLYMARATAEIVSDITGDTVWQTGSGIHLIWRAVSAAMDMITIWLVFLIGLRLHGRWTGLLAALLYAAAVLPIQQAHFGTMDATATMFVTLALFFAVRTQDTGSLWDYIAFGLALGAAAASRFNVAPLAAIIIVVAMIRALPAFDQQLGWNARNRLLAYNFAGLVLAGLASILVFRITQPTAFTGPGFFGLLPDSRFLAMLGQAQFQVSGEMDIPPNWQWVNRVPYLFALQNIVLWGAGIALGLSSLFALIWSVWRLARGRIGALRNVTLVTWVLLYFGLYGGIWVMSMRYYLVLYPALAVLAAWAAVEFWRRADRSGIAWRRYIAAGTIGIVAGFTLLWAGMFTNIYRNMATFTQASYWVWENVPGNFTMRIDDAPDDTPLINIALHNRGADKTLPIDQLLIGQSTMLQMDRPYVASFTAPADGTISAINATYLADPLDDESEKTLRIVVSTEEGETPLTTASFTHTFPRDDFPLGDSYIIELDEPFDVTVGETYYFSVDLISGVPIISSGSVVARETWDEVMPASVCELPPGMTLADNPPSGMFGPRECNARSPFNSLLNGYEIETIWEDTAVKRDHLEGMLNHADYVVISTNRRYDTHIRNPMRWPLTNRYFEALFSGELGFEIEAMFQEQFELGPLKVSDQYLPIYDGPEWLREFEAEEAFHVYDHPVVFIFRKSDDYSPENTHAILHDVVLTRVGEVTGGYNNPTITNVMTLSSLAADESPTQLQFTREMQAIQTEGGTWSERFNTANIINQNQSIALVVWWLAIMLFGFAAWPLLFVAMPALADRGYGVAKFTGILLVAWTAWALSSLRVPFWSGAGIMALLAALIAISGVIAWTNRARLITFIRGRWRLLLMTEAITFALFLILIGIRITNPDLWHAGYGGEKPMDFAYFNAVLRSTIFPPIDPWFAGGHINYYYFGFIIVGAPTLLTGIVPSLAYNLILPTLFAMTGIAAFSVAFSIVNGWRSSDHPSESSGDEYIPPARPRPVGNPWVAGIAALLLTVILGNLGTVRELGRGLTVLGGHQPSATLEQFLRNQYIDEYTGQRLIAPSDIPPEEMARINEQAAQRATTGDLGDRLRYALDEPISIMNGIGLALSGRELPINADRWFWGPTRIIAESSMGTDGAINEMPFFTFLYADLHAHMIAMPLMLFAMAFVYSELMAAGRDRRRLFAQALAIFLGALAVGLLFPTNTWDFPTFIILSVLGLGYAWWLRWEKFTRWSMLDMFIRIGGFITLAVVVALPFTFWFASGITEFKIWDGRKTALWAYLMIYGLFLFLIVSMLTWETARWLRAVTVRDIRGKSRPLTGLAVLAGLVLIFTLGMVIAGYSVALIVLPLVAWIGVLFFRPGQSRSMQYVLVLAGLALCITLGTEIITLAFDTGRQNTIFKFYIQAWLLLGVVGGAAFAWVVANAGRWSNGLLGLFYIPASILIFIAALFPLLATQGKAVYRMQPTPPGITLDGMDYMRYASHIEPMDTLVSSDQQPRYESFDLIHDYNTIRWLQENVDGSPVIIEALSQRILYQWGGRISKYTGLPTVIGWDYHQRQQRSLSNLNMLIAQRVANVNAFYTTTDSNEAIRMMRHYNIAYIIVSAYEQARYGPSGGLVKFDELVDQGLLTLAYEEGLARIYRVNHDELDAVSLAQARTQLEQNE